MTVHPGSEGTSSATAHPDAGALATALLRVHARETPAEFQNSGIRLDPETNLLAVQQALIQEGPAEQRNSMILDTLRRLSERGLAVDRTTLNALTFTERAIELWVHRALLGSERQQALLRLRPRLAGLVLLQAEFVGAEDHPISQILRLHDEVFLGWRETMGVLPRELHAFAECFDALFQSSRCADNQAQMETAARLQALHGAWLQRQQKLETRLREAEQGRDQVAERRGLLIANLRRLTQGATFPEAVAHFLSHEWLDSLLLPPAQVQQHDASTQEQDVALSQRLVTVFAQRAEATQMAVIFEQAEGLLDDVGQRLVGLAHDPVSLQKCLDRLEAALLATVRQQTAALAYQEVVLEDSDGTLGSETDRRRTWRNAERLLQPEQWYLGVAAHPVRLCDVLPGQQKVLWSDVQGRKAGLGDLQEVLAAVEQGRIRPVETHDYLLNIMQTLARAWISLDRLQRKQEVERLRAEKQALLAAEEKARREVQAIVQAREAEQQRAAAREAAEAQARANAAADAQARADEEKIKATRLALAALNLGDPVTLHQGDTARQGSLAVRLPASGKLIFVDEFGLKLLEVNGDAAVEAILEGRLELGDSTGQNEARRARAMGRMGRSL